MGRKLGGALLIGAFLVLVVNCMIQEKGKKLGEKELTTIQGYSNKWERVRTNSEWIKACKLDILVTKYMEQLTLEEKIGQLFFVTVQQAQESHTIGQEVGGIILFKQDITTKDETIKLIEALQEKASTPLWIGVDEEGGRVSRVGINSDIVDRPFMTPQDIGKTGSTQIAYEEARRMGKVLASLGININFAPNADIFNNPSNTVIGDRSFGGTKEEVVPMVIAFAKGLQDEDITPVIKHFPGHGNTVQDSHEGLAYVEKSIKELEEEELVPFFEATQKGVNMVMVGHLVVSEIDRLPATLSHKWGDYITQNFNRKEVLFITDAMNMGGVVGEEQVTDIALQSFLGGMDIILMPEELEATIECFKKAYETGELSKERLEESVEKILLKKVEQNLLVLE